MAGRPFEKRRSGNPAAGHVKSQSFAIWRADKHLTLSKNLVGLRLRLGAKRLASPPFASCWIAVTASPLKLLRVMTRPIVGSKKLRWFS